MNHARALTGERRPGMDGFPEEVRSVKLTQARAMVALGVVLGLFGAVLCAQEAEPEKPLAATVVSVAGTVEVKPPGEEAWRPAQVDMKLGEGTSISTGVRSKVGLDFDGHAVVTISRPSIVVVTRFLMKQGQVQTLLQLKVGSMKAGVLKERIASDFKVVTPAVTLSVRGTEIAEITYSEMGTKVCMGSEGLLDMTKYYPDMEKKTRRIPKQSCLLSDYLLQIVDAKKQKRTWRTRWYGWTPQESKSQTDDPTDPEQPKYELIREGGHPENERRLFQSGPGDSGRKITPERPNDGYPDNGYPNYE